MQALMSAACWDPGSAGQRHEYMGDLNGMRCAPAHSGEWSSIAGCNAVEGFLKCKSCDGLRAPLQGIGAQNKLPGAHCRALPPGACEKTCLLTPLIALRGKTLTKSFSTMRLRIIE
jgi:hypothetical protein